MMRRTNQTQAADDQSNVRPALPARVDTVMNNDYTAEELEFLVNDPKLKVEQRDPDEALEEAVGIAISMSLASDLAPRQALAELKEKEDKAVREAMAADVDLELAAALERSLGFESIPEPVGEDDIDPELAWALAQIHSQAPQAAPAALSDRDRRGMYFTQRLQAAGRGQNNAQPAPTTSNATRGQSNVRPALTTNSRPAPRGGRGRGGL